MKQKTNMELQQLLKQASQALRSGDKQASRHWAAKAAALDGKDERAWILLGMLGSSRASLEYFSTALKINPISKRARQGMRWAVRRGLSNGILDENSAQDYLASIKPYPPKKSIFAQVVRFASLASFILIVGFIGMWMWAGTPDLLQLAFQVQNAKAMALNAPVEPPLPTPTNTPAPTSTPLPSPTSTPEPTQTPLPSATATLAPTAVPTEPPVQISMPSEVSERDRWIDVDLTKQVLTAYEGSVAVRSFIVSTGTSQYPTVTGEYKTYVKYESAPMSGPGYYLPGVPYIMYFYRGYGIHGTYWHDNFGTPMSHGCVNMTIDDSRWVYEFAPLGTWVNVHN